MTKLYPRIVGPLKRSLNHLKKGHGLNHLVQFLDRSRHSRPGIDRSTGRPANENPFLCKWRGFNPVLKALILDLHGKSMPGKSPQMVGFNVDLPRVESVKTTFFNKSKLIDQRILEHPNLSKFTVDLGGSNKKNSSRIEAKNTLHPQANLHRFLLMLHPGRLTWFTYKSPIRKGK